MDHIYVLPSHIDTVYKLDFHVIAIYCQAIFSCPEHLTSIIPRLFVKNKNFKMSHYENTKRLYDDSYKHGFAVDLTDPIFNKYYKIATQHEHISCNYSRKLLKDEKEATYAYKDIKYLKKMKTTRKCDFEEKLEIEECPFIDYIINSLILFKVGSLNKIELE
eukprot:492021_1